MEQNHCKWFYSFGKFKLKRNSKTSTEFSTKTLRFAIEIQHLKTIGVEKQHAGLVLKFSLRLENKNINKTGLTSDSVFSTI